MVRHRKGSQSEGESDKEKGGGDTCDEELEDYESTDDKNVERGERTTDEEGKRGEQKSINNQDEMEGFMTKSRIERSPTRVTNTMDVTEIEENKEQSSGNQETNISGTQEIVDSVNQDINSSVNLEINESGTQEIVSKQNISGDKLREAEKTAQSAAQQWVMNKINPKQNGVETREGECACKCCNTNKIRLGELESKLINQLEKIKREMMIEIGGMKAKSSKGNKSEETSDGLELISEDELRISEADAEYDGEDDEGRNKKKKRTGKKKKGHAQKEKEAQNMNASDEDVISQTSAINTEKKERKRERRADPRKKSEAEIEKFIKETRRMHDQQAGKTREWRREEEDKIRKEKPKKLNEEEQKKEWEERKKIRLNIHISYEKDKYNRVEDVIKTIERRLKFRLETKK
ncbi:golgin subfamily A member 6-like protein 22 [Microplitis demolitor]|uniref:golgin subfamily A member 6-like protein 22 n=1 Tax=Microplitis demolitor TaxID=69319 RepID=UPI00235B66AD|nr:golgin subfamily A member 6-like protein 22 [Microplitis demolitor]